MIAAGALLHRVSIQERTEASDGHDGLTETWATTRNRISARVHSLLGRDLERARQIDPRVSHEVSLRYWQAYRTVLDGGRARLLYHPTSTSDDDRTLEIVSPPVDVDERHVELRMLCREAA